MAGVDDTCTSVNWMDIDLRGKTTAAAITDILAINCLSYVILGIVSVGTANAQGYANCNPDPSITIGY
ncbi:hypothetical protein NSMS1_37470 [Nostoc sp. MS1]|nr:hypothetical protein NSMS1_37470 [Nostoc sp. MS1]